MRIISSRPSRSHPEVEHQIIENDKGEINCTCPACFNGGECYEMLKIRTQKEYELQLRVKHSLIENPLPRMATHIRKAWEYQDQQTKEWLDKYPEDSIKPQYERFIRRTGWRHPDVIMKERTNLLELRRLLR